MSPITHFLVGWTALERAQATDRDKALVVLAGLAPDLDGVGIIVDFATRTLGFAATNYYQEFHRVYGHGLPAALAIAALVACFALCKFRAAASAFIAVHLHFVCDILGSRGASAEDIWGIAYFSPLAASPVFEWRGQWELVSWQNMLITLGLLVWIFARGVRDGYTPLRLASRRADQRVVHALRARFGREKTGGD